MSTNNLQSLIKTSSDSISIALENEDHLIGALEDFKRENYRYPSEVIFSEKMAQYYFDKYEQGVSVPVKYKGKKMYFTVNVRFRASELLMRY